MSVINFSKANCRNCYKCVRACPVKAVKVKDEQAIIVESMCIGCGQCLRVCPKNAKEVMSELDVVKAYIGRGHKVIASVAPSFAAAFNTEDYRQIVSGIKELGFTGVEETAVAAAIVSEKYREYYEADDGRSYITTCCPSVNYLIKKYYSSLTENMLPVVSPMVCHGKMLKEKYGSDSKIVFIGPCLSKKMEALEVGCIDAVLTFDELNKWFEAEKIFLDRLEGKDFDSQGEAARLYPTTGGIAVTLDHSKSDKDVFRVDGIDNCIDLLESMKRGKIKNTFIEMSLCTNSCVNGPAMTDEFTSSYIKKSRVEKYVSKCEKNNDIAQKIEKFYDLDLFKEYKSKETKMNTPSQEEIRKILASIGKLVPQDELNCGGCGYNTCRDKAIAVYNGMAEKNMCLPYMRQRAETMSNIIFDLTPNIIMIVNDELEIIEFNPSSENFFNVKQSFAKGKPVSMLMDDSDMILVRESQDDIVSKRIQLKDFNAIMLETILYLEEQNAMLIILNDITNEEEKEEELQRLKMKTIDMAQEVIDKQMRVAQEIASLLGETTAETKVTLGRLKKIVQGEDGDCK